MLFDPKPFFPWWLVSLDWYAAHEDFLANEQRGKHENWQVLPEYRPWQLKGHVLLETFKDKAEHVFQTAVLSCVWFQPNQDCMYVQKFVVRFLVTEYYDMMPNLLHFLLRQSL